MTDCITEKANRRGAFFSTLTYERAVVALGFVVVSRIRKARTAPQKQALHIEDFKAFRTAFCGALRERRTPADLREITGSRERSSRLKARFNVPRSIARARALARFFSRESRYYISVFADLSLPRISFFFHAKRIDARN